MTDRNFHVRRASPDDAPGITRVLQAVAAERTYSAIDQPWSADEQRSYLLSLSNREATHVATDPSGDLVGYQSLDLYSPFLSSSCPRGEDEGSGARCSRKRPGLPGPQATASS